jgi:hypothetical protein
MSPPRITPERISQTGLRQRLLWRVSKAVKEGRVTPGPDGLFVLADAIDEWFQKTDPRKTGGKGLPTWSRERPREGKKPGSRPSISPVEAPETEEATARDDGGAASRRDTASPEGREALTFAEARTANEIS